MDDLRERDELVAAAIQASQRAADLVAKPLTFARRATLEAEIIEAGDMLSEISVMARRLLPETIQIEDVPPQGVTFLRADRAQLGSALLNLVLNARDAMQEKGKIVLKAEIRQGPAGPEEAPQHICLSVTDNGPGMDAETRARVFEPFFTTKAVGQGSGLGLPMVKGFVEQSGGRVHIDSSPEGTCVALHLPLVPPPMSGGLPDPTPV